MTYEYFRETIENEVNKAKDDNIILDIRLTSSTLNQLLEMGKDFGVEDNMLSFVLPEEQLITIISTEDFSVKNKHVLTFWQLVSFDNYNWNSDIPITQKRVYIL